MRTLNAHRLFAGTTANPGYLGALDIGAAKEKFLRGARDLVREALRTGLRDLQDRGVGSILEQRFLAKAASLPALRPRFRMQGSMKYRTLNDPAQKQHQQIDIDDGVYLPTSFVTANGSARPVLASRAYFHAVEEILQPVCDRMGWTLDRTKRACVRIQISKEAHIDLPLYAIPDDQLHGFAEDRAATFAKANSQIDELEFSESAYKALPADQIMLARRNAEWRESDPRKIEDWFLDAIAEHGEIVRHVCRYLKGWRDQQFKSCKISSLLLMTCAVTAFDSLRGEIARDRDDLGLGMVARGLASQISGDVANPVFVDQILNDDWTEAERATYVRAAQALHQEIEDALNLTYDKDIAIGRFRNAFGIRIPASPDLIVIDSKEDEVFSYTRARVSAPDVPRTTSG